MTLFVWLAILYRILEVLLKSVIINGKKISRNDKPYIVSEIACSHDGSIERVIKMIDASAEAGVDAVQFQIFRTERILVPGHANYALVKTLEINKDEWLN